MGCALSCRKSRAGQGGHGSSRVGSMLPTKCGSWKQDLNGWLRVLASKSIDGEMGEVGGVSGIHVISHGGGKMSWRGVERELLSAPHPFHTIYVVIGRFSA